MVRQSALTKRVSSLLTLDIADNPTKPCPDILKLRLEYRQGTEAFHKALENRFHYVKRQQRGKPDNYLDLIRQVFNRLYKQPILCTNIESPSLDQQGRKKVSGQVRRPAAARRPRPARRGLPSRQPIRVQVILGISSCYAFSSCKKSYQSPRRRSQVTATTTKNQACKHG